MNPDAVLNMPDLCDRKHHYSIDLALLLLERLGVDLSRIDLKAVGPFENYRGEIQEQFPEPGRQLKPVERVALSVGFFGCVDYLPYQVYYGLPGISALGGETWEDRARSLMSPFDATTVRTHVELLGLKRCYSGGLVNQYFVNGLLDLFKLPPHRERMTAAETMFWLALLPSYHEWSGNAECVGEMLEAVFELPVQICEHAESSADIPEEIQSRLGERHSHLGDDFISGGSITDYDSAYEVIIGDIEPEDVPQWLPGGDRRTELDRLITMCMPEYLEARVVLDVKRRPVRLGRESAEAYLGVSVTICDSTTKERQAVEVDAA
jgi:hypothetical protein